MKKIERIALINPNKSLQEENFKLFEMFKRNETYLKRWFSPPLSLIVIASLTPENIEVTVIDEHFEEIDFDQTYDIVGLTAMSQQAYRAYEIADIFRKKNIPVVMGGIHATIMPEEALKHVDTVFIGESEELWGQFLIDFHAGKVKKRYRNEVHFDLTKSLIPRYDLINYEQFKKYDNCFKFLPIQATRGCPHDCSFCVVSKFYGKKIRKKPIKQVVNEIMYLKKLNYDSLLFFTDDNLFVDRKYSKELLKALIPLKIKYIGLSDVKMADDDELLKLAYLSGCLIIFVGFESIESDALNEVNSNNWKMQQLQNYKEAINKIQNNGIVVFGGFVMGFKNDDLSTFDHVKDFVLEHKIAAQFTLLTPLPGSRVYDQFKSEGRLIQETFWDKCSFFDMTFRHDNMSKEDAENKMIWLHDEVFKEENVMKRNKHMMEIYKKLPPRWEL
jgi:radical SAM superfamily enzyme YgiQ (UPF0313 family)